MRTLSLLVGLLLSLSATAQIYKSVDESGNVVFSDRPANENAVPVELQQPTTYTPRKLPTTSGQAVPQDETEVTKASASTYTRVEIVAPEQDETIRDNTGQVAVSIALQPRLRPGHSLTVLMDGAVLVENLKTTSLPMSNIDRGSHELRVLVMDDQGREVGSSAPVTFHLHRAALGAARPSPR